MIDSRKANIYLVYKILEEYTDLEHYLTQQEIVEKIKMDYGYECERKSVGSSISLLTDLGFDIVKGQNNKGFALASRQFDKNEIAFLIDGIFSSKVIPGEQAKDIVEKLVKNLSIYERKNYKYLYKTTEITRTNNKNKYRKNRRIKNCIF